MLEFDMLKALTLILFCTLAQAKDLHDHPLISPYQGSKILEHESQEFDSVSFPTENEFNKNENPMTLEGKVDRLSYQNPEGRSTLEVYRNYQQALQKAGFTVVKEVKVAYGHRLVGLLGLNNTSFCYDPLSAKSHFEILKKESPSGTVHVALFVAPCKPDKTVIWIVEGKKMQTDQVAVNAISMGESLDREGHVALYGIQFDFDKADIRPDSVPTLTEIAKLMTSRPQLSIYVVGHTDNQGETKYNMELSQKRSDSVVRWLTTQKKVPANRLQGYGVGPLAPKATNRTEEGRALNRRVELIDKAAK